MHPIMLVIADLAHIQWWIIFLCVFKIWRLMSVWRSSLLNGERHRRSIHKLADSIFSWPTNLLLAFEPMSHHLQKKDERKKRKKRKRREKKKEKREEEIEPNESAIIMMWKKGIKLRSARSQTKCYYVPKGKNPCHS